MQACLLRPAYYILFLLMFADEVDLKAEHSIIDSLLHQIMISEADSNRVKIYQELSRHFFSQSFSQSLVYADSSVRVARRSGYHLGIAHGEYCRGYALLEMGHIHEAIQAGKTADKIFSETNDSASLAKIYNLLGVCYLRLDSIDKALDMLFDAAAIGEKRKDFSLAASSYNNIGEIYNYAGDRNNARRFYGYALDKILRTNEDFNRTMILMNLANMQDSTGQKIALLREAIDIAARSSFDGSLAYSYASLGDVYFEDSKNYPQALESYKKGLDNARRSGDLRMITHNLLYSSACWVQLQQLDSAETYLGEIAPDSLEDSYLRAYFYYLALLKKSRGEWNVAFELLDSSLQMNQDYFNEELASHISEANVKYDSKRKEAELITKELEIERHKGQRNFVIFSGTGFLAFLIIIGLFLRTRHNNLKAATELALNLEKERVKHLEELSKSRERIFNNLSHELKTPLTLIIGPLEIAANNIKNLPLKEEVTLALSNSKRLSSLVNEILDFSRLDQGKLSLQPESFELTGFLKRVFSAFSSLAASRYIYLEDNLSDCEDTYIVTDQGKLEKIVNNLVSNGIKFSRSGGTVTLFLDPASLRDNILSFSIADEGIGISSVDQEQIFKRYFQSDNTIDYPGTGIGLSLVKEYCQFMGGNIELESKLNFGSKFTVTIPVSGATIEDKEDEVGINFRSTPFLKSIQAEVLIVEDDPHMAKYLKKLMSGNHLCTLVFNGRQALDVLRTKKFDLIISDVMMPEIDGFALREQINKDPRLQAIPFILLTARSLDSDKIRGLNLGVDDYISKPFLPAELLARVTNLIGNRMVRQKWAKEQIVPFEEQLIRRAQAFIEKNIDNHLFKVSDLASHLNYSIRQLNRIIKTSTGLTPVELILEVRLLRAYSLLSSQRSKTISEVRSAVGIESASYFTKKFHARFGVNPSQIGCFE